MSFASSEVRGVVETAGFSTCVGMGQLSGAFGGETDARLG